MSGGETSLSGNDDNSLPLQYTPGYEQLYINGVLMVRGQDYTATTGTTVTGLTALVVNDVVEIFSAVARTVADVYTQTQSDARFAPKTGNVIQKIVTPYTTYSSYTSSVDISGFSVSITPKFANSKIFISVVGQVGASATGQIMGIQLKENGTNLSFQTAIARIVDVGTTFTCAFATQRTPNSTALLTYQISFVYGGSSTGYINGHSFNATGTSAITVEEIAQ
jgi:hypothetical protein